MTPRRAPKGEPAKDTIAFQAKQIRDLANRVDDLHSKLTTANILIGHQQEQIEKTQCALETSQAKLAYETAHASGYRQRIYDEKLDASRIAADREKNRNHISMRNMNDAPF